MHFGSFFFIIYLEYILKFAEWEQFILGFAALRAADIHAVRSCLLEVAHSDRQLLPYM